MEAQTLLKGHLLESPASKPDIQSLCMDTRQMQKGALFFALKGQRYNGENFIEEALGKGALGIVAEAPEASVKLKDKAALKGKYFRVSKAREALSAAAARLHQNPDSRLKIHGITGTNGKTTTSWLLRHLLAKNKIASGLIGTICYDLIGSQHPAKLTSPEAHELYAYLSTMESHHAEAVALELSSIALTQGRAHGLELHTASFLNFSQDHLDLHGNMENYFAAKAALFTSHQPQPRHALFNVDCEAIAELHEAYKGPKMSFSLKDKNATFYAEAITSHPNAISCTLHAKGQSMPMHLPLIGAHNIQNALAAVALASTHGLNLAELLPQLESFKGVPGRLQIIPNESDLLVLVDYAHSPEALENALKALRAISHGRLLLVFGCGGNRDAAKRPLMTQAAQTHADYCWATADNPRKEALELIFKDMQKGVLNSKTIHFEPDRKTAIALALQAARPSDTILIAGKGHENYQELPEGRIAFDDAELAAELLKEHS